MIFPCITGAIFGLIAFARTANALDAGMTGLLVAIGVACAFASLRIVIEDALREVRKDRPRG